METIDLPLFQSRVRAQCNTCCGAVHVPRGTLECPRHDREVEAHQIAVGVRKAHAALDALPKPKSDADDKSKAAYEKERAALQKAVAVAEERLQAEKSTMLISADGDIERWAGRNCPVLQAWDAAGKPGFVAEHELNSLTERRDQFLKSKDATPVA